MEKLKAVLIDDEFWTREVIRSLGHWERLGIEIVGEASDGLFGQEIIKQLKPDIVITDVKMPEMNGLDLAECLQNEGVNAKIIIASGYDDFELVHRALKIGVFDYLLKPIKEEELNKQLEACANSIRSNSRKEASPQLTVNLSTENWAQTMSQLLPCLTEAVETGNIGSVEENFSRLSKILAGQEKIAIQIYVYSLLNERLLSLIKSASKTNPSFQSRYDFHYVFGEDTTMDNMLDFCKKTYIKIAEGIAEGMHSKAGFDFSCIKRYVDTHYLDKNLSLESLASSFGLNKEYLSRGWKTKFNVLFSDYLASLKMSKARELLRTSSLSIARIGVTVGYDDPANFYRAFKKYFGMKPMEIRDETKNDNATSQPKPRL